MIVSLAFTVPKWGAGSPLHLQALKPWAGEQPLGTTVLPLKVGTPKKKPSECFVFLPPGTNLGVVWGMGWLSACPPHPERGSPCPPG